MSYCGHRYFSQCFKWPSQPKTAASLAFQKDKADWDMFDNGVIELLGSNCSMMPTKTETLCCVGSFLSGAVGGVESMCEDVESKIPKTAKTSRAKRTDGQVLLLLCLVWGGETDRGWTTFQPVFFKHESICRWSYAMDCGTCKHCNNSPSRTFRFLCQQSAYSRRHEVCGRCL